MRRVLLSIAVLILSAAALHAQQPTPAKAEEKLAWETEWTTAFRIAKEQRKLVMVDFFATWCMPCRQMDANVFGRPELRERLEKFVLLRIDGERQRKVRNAQKVTSYPTIVVFDPGERERLRVIGYRGADSFRGMLDAFEPTVPDLLTASDLLAAGNDIDANFLLAKTYNRIGMFASARTHYAAAKTAASKRGKKGTAQLAEALSALTYAREGQTSRAIKILQKLAASPADRETEALLCIALGNAHAAAKDKKSALEAFRRAQTASTRGAAVYNEAERAIAQLQ